MVPGAARDCDHRLSKTPISDDSKVISAAYMLSWVEPSHSMFRRPCAGSSTSDRCSHSRLHDVSTALRNCHDKALVA